MKHSTVKTIVYFSVGVLLTIHTACTPSSPKAMVNPASTEEGLRSVRAAIAKDIPEAINAVNLAYRKKIIDGALNQALLDYLDSVDNLAQQMIQENGMENVAAIKKENNLKSAPPGNNALQTALKLHRDIVFIKEMFTAEKLSSKN